MPEMELEEEAEKGEDLEASGEKPELVRLSLQSMVGLTTEKSMKMRAKIGQNEVVVLIDSGQPVTSSLKSWLRTSNYLLLRQESSEDWWEMDRW